MVRHAPGLRRAAAVCADVAARVHRAQTVETFNGKRHAVILVRTHPKQDRISVKALLDDGSAKWFEVVGRNPKARVVEYLPEA